MPKVPLQVQQQVFGLEDVKNLDPLEERARDEAPEGVYYDGEKYIAEKREQTAALINDLRREGYIFDRFMSPDEYQSTLQSRREELAAEGIQYATVFRGDLIQVFKKTSDN